MEYCKLCNEVAELRVSHLLPAAIFKAIKVGYEPASTPIMMDGINKKTIQIDKQFTKQLLCENCEQRFNKQGEKYVISQMFRKSDDFPLRDKLREINPDLQKTTLPIFFPRTLIKADIDPEKYAYFAISVFWRGSVTRWDKLVDPYFHALGSKYESEFQKYLLNKKEFPENTYLAVIFDPEINPITMTTAPISNRGIGEKVTCRVHSFFIPGIKFSAYVGGEISADLKKIYEKTNCRILFFSEPLRGSNAHKLAINDAKSNRVVGKFTKLLSND